MLSTNDKLFYVRHKLSLEPQINQTSKVTNKQTLYHMQARKRHSKRKTHTFEPLPLCTLHHTNQEWNACALARGIRPQQEENETKSGFNT